MYSFKNGRSNHIGESKRFVEQVSNPNTGTCSTKLSLRPYGAHNSINKIWESKVVVQSIQNVKDWFSTCNREEKREKEEY